jgi:cutinase
MCQHDRVSAPKIAHWLGVTVVVVSTLLFGPPVAASAAPCPDIDVTFARATGEPPGVGVVGQEFVDALRGQIGGRSMAVYAVNYPASADFVPSANAGTEDANAHVNSVAANCPNTKLVLGGYSQGALVIDQITIARAPVAGFMPDILTAEVADHVAALALFGNPSDRYLGESVSTASPWYGAKAIDLCVQDDPVCTGAMYTIPTHEDMSTPQHLSYAHSGMPAQAAAFVAGKL